MFPLVLTCAPASSGALFGLRAQYRVSHSLSYPVVSQSYPVRRASINRLRRRVWTLAGLAGCLLPSTLAQAQISLIGTGSLPGTDTDLSGLTGTYTASDGSGTIPQNLLGSMGSGLAYTGFDNLYVAVNDRGFGNGTTTSDYLDRFQVVQVNVNPTTNTVTPTLLATRFFT